MKDLATISSALQTKIEKLVHLQARLKEENKRLLIEKQELEGTVVKLRLAMTLNRNTEQTKDIKLKINELVREIDKSIALLNR